MDRTKLTKDDINSMSKAASLNLSDDRQEMLVTVLSDTFSLLDTLKAVKPGETAPAFAFQAKWEKSS